MRRMMLMPITNAKSGFTLPELLLSAAILAYCLSLILTTFNHSIALNDASRNLTTAVSHAEFVLEDMRGTSFGSIATDISDGHWNWNAATVTSKGLTALNSESISASSSGSNPVDITVTVNWHDLRGRIRSRVLKTSISG